MFKTVYIVAAAAIAAVIVAMPSLSMQVQARGPVLGAKGDRVDARPLGTACSQREWPYFETSCLRDPKHPFGEARQVRIVTTDRLLQPVESTLLASR
jgi:hypothetical protein